MVHPPSSAVFFVPKSSKVFSIFSLKVVITKTVMSVFKLEEDGISVMKCMESILKSSK